MCHPDQDAVAWIGQRSVALLRPVISIATLSMRSAQASVALTKIPYVMIRESGCIVGDLPLLVGPISRQ